MFDLMNLENKTKQVEFRESCKCVCRINSSVCSEKQRLKENKCRCECLINTKCQNDFAWNYSNCECENRKSAKLIVEEKHQEINDFTQNKTISIIKKVENCKPFVASSIFSCFIYCVIFSDIDWNYGLFSLLNKEKQMFYLIKFILEKKLSVS